MAITREQVFTIAEKLFEDGRNPTVSGIREQLGTGSMTTINKHLKAWVLLKRESQEKTLPQEILDKCLPVLADLWRFSKQSFDEELATLRQSMTEKVESAQQEAENAFTQVDRLNQQIQSLQAENNTLNSEIVELRTQIKVLDVTSAKEEQRNTTLDERNQTLIAKVTELQTKLELTTSQAPTI